MPSRAAVLRSYRELLFLIRRLPPDKQAAAVQEARQTMQANKGETDALKSSDMHRALVGRIGFLRLSLPRQLGDRYARAGRYVLREGRLVEGEADRESRVADGKLSMEEARQRHHQLMRRQYFGREPPRSPGLF